MTTVNAVQSLVDHLFRRESGKMVSALTRVFGPTNLDLAEDVVQETLLLAMQRWPFDGVPGNPAGWLYQAAKNKAIDTIRRQQTFRRFEPELTRELQAAELVYETLREGAVEVVYDDRELGPGEKFADAELLGCPLRLTVGRRTLESGEIEDLG